MRRFLIAALTSASALAMGVHSAAAQSAPTTTLNEVVVTGTLIRGVAPTGAVLTTVTNADIVKLGAVDTSQLLGALPQDSAFNNRPQVGSFGAFQTVNAPLLRYLGGGSSGSNSTLLLLDGVRLPGMGVQQTSADIDAITSGALQRVDVVPDGGSATYGADAVGGVVNLITRRSFDGLEVGGHFGGADDYKQWDVHATAGKNFDKGSAWISYDYTHHGLLLNSDRDYTHNLNYTARPFTGANLTCNPGNFTSGFTVYPIANGAPVVGPPNTCDNSQATTFFPEESRHSVLGGFDYDLANWLKFDLRGYYMHRDATNDGGPNVYSGVPATSVLAGAPVSGSAAGIFTDPEFAHMYGHTTTKTWGVIPRLKAQLGHDWQLDAFLNVAEGDARAQSQTAGGNAPVLAADAANGTFDPLTGAFATTAAGQAAKAEQANYYGFSSGKDQIVNTRAVFDGPLFTLPGGDVRAALGGEYMHEKFTQRNGNAELGDFESILPNSVSRKVASAFGELSIPIVGENNHIAGIDSLTFSAAGRYDHYSDFGGTFDPKFALNWNPVSWWTLRGNWGKSFQAPSLASTAGAIPPGVVAFPAGIFGANPAFPDTAGKTVLLLFPGGGVDLQPQKAKTWEVGTDITPPAIPGLKAHFTYYNINFKNQIANPAFYTASFYSLYPNSYIMNTPSAPLTTAQIQQYIGAAFNAAQVAQYVNNPSSVYALENGLQQNLAATSTSGLDFSLDYQHPTDFGSIFAGFAGTYILTFDTRATPTSVVQDLDANSVARLRLSTTVGAQVGNLYARATWNRSGGYKIPANAGNAFQSNVAPFNVVNLAFVYTPKATNGALEGTTFSLNIDNITDAKPPYYNGTNGGGSGFAGFTLGRFAQLGVTKKF